MTDSGQGDRQPRNRKKLMMSVGVSAAAALLILATGLQGLMSAKAAHPDNPTEGYNIHVTVDRHDATNLNTHMDHYCKLDTRIVAVCILYATDNKAKPGTGPQLSQIEFIITDEQYQQLPLRERQNWHNHAVELTPERGMPTCVELPAGLTCNALIDILHKTYGKLITIWDPADGVPSYEPYVFMVDSPFSLGQDANDNLHKESPTGCGDKSSVNLPCKDVTLKIKALDPSGEERHMFIKILLNGQIVKDGFAPLEFAAKSGTAYQVRATNFQDRVFDHWEDGNTNRVRQVILSADTELTANYRIESTAHIATPPESQ